MFNAIVIASGNLRFGPLQYAAVQSQQLLILRSFDRYPLIVELDRLLRAVPPDVILLDLDDAERAIPLAEMAHSTCPEAAIIGLEGNEPHQCNIAANGIVHVMPFPCGPEDVIAALDTAIHAVDSEPCDKLFTFLPAKAGTGCTTIVLHTALALSQQLGRNTLLIEADLRSGTIAFQLDRQQQGSIQNVLSAGPNLDHFAWDRNVADYRGLHMLLTNGSAPAQLPGWRDYHALLRFARQKYDAILVDLPELVNPGTAELVRRSQAVFLVASQDLLSLKLAGRRLQELAALGIRMEKVNLLMSRWRMTAMSKKKIAALLNREITATFPDDPRHMRREVQTSELHPLDSPLGIACADFAATLFGMPSHPARTKVISMLRNLVGRRA